MNEEGGMYEEEHLETYLKDHHTHFQDKLLRGIIADGLKFMNKAQ